jgi:hypothetical protein
MEYNYTFRRRNLMMKKLLLALTPLVLFLSHVPVMAGAAGAKVPTNLCYTGAGHTSQLTIKSLGTLKTSGTAVKQYGIFGYADTGFSSPVQGSAYVIPGLTVLHGTLTGSYAVSGVVRDLRIEFFIDLAAQAGTGSAWLQTSAGTNNVVNGALALTNCANLAIAGSIPGALQRQDQQGFIDDPR